MKVVEKVSIDVLLANMLELKRLYQDAECATSAALNVRDLAYKNYYDANKTVREAFEARFGG